MRIALTGRIDALPPEATIMVDSPDEALNSLRDIQKRALSGANWVANLSAESAPMSRRIAFWSRIIPGDRAALL